MKDLFLPYELAVIAKEKGYLAPLGFAVFDHENNNELTYTKPNNTFVGWQDYLAAPLYQQIVDWLREEKKTIIEVKPVDDWTTWIFTITQEDLMSAFFIHKWNEIEYPSYHLALISAVQEAFKLI